MSARPTVLVVDDAPDVRFLVAEILRRGGLDVVTAASGTEAIERLATGWRPAVMVLDVQMPGRDGWETVAAVRRLPGGDRVPVVLCTVKEQPEDVSRAAALGCAGYVAKPFAVDDLRRAVAGAMEMNL